MRRNGKCLQLFLSCGKSRRHSVRILSWILLVSLITTSYGVSMTALAKGAPTVYGAETLPEPKAASSAEEISDALPGHEGQDMEQDASDSCTHSDEQTEDPATTEEPDGESTGDGDNGTESSDGGPVDGDEGSTMPKGPDGEPESGSGSGTEGSDGEPAKPRAAAVAEAADTARSKFVSGWNYMSRGGSTIHEDDDYQYSMDYYMPISSDRSLMIRKLCSILPDRICCSGFNGSNELVLAGLTPETTPPGFGLIRGYVNLCWNTEQVTAPVDTFCDGLVLHFEAMPVSSSGWNIRVNSNDPALPEDCNDTGERSGILNLTVTFHEIHLEEHIVPGIDPSNTRVDLFDYWVDQDGASGNDLLGISDHHDGPVIPDIPRSGMEDWNKGINAGRLLLFGDGNIHAGYWNKGAGAASAYGKKNAGMTGIVRRTLQDGYPVIDTEEMQNQLYGCGDISDSCLCGDHIGDPQDARYDSADPQNISRTVISSWTAAHGTDASLNYLFDPEIQESNKRSYSDVKGLFQIDQNGYYYYDMRQNFAEYSSETNRFILYDAPAVERTDGSYENGSFTQGRSVGNFLPFNTGAQVFDLVDEHGKLSGNESISSNNGRTTAGYMNHHLGMTVEIDFCQTPDGMIHMGADGNMPMTFQFSGDDDVWIFIDDVLVLDLGGIHSEIYGTVNFASGEIRAGQSWKTNGFPYTDKGTVDLDRLYDTAGCTLKTTLKEQFEVAGKADCILWKDQTFADNTSHTLKMFYLERGNYDSSLAIRYNLLPLFYHRLYKTDPDGVPVEQVSFDLYPAEPTTAEDPDGIPCLHMDAGAGHDTGDVFYVKPSSESSLIHFTTASDGAARFLDDNGKRFHFADQSGSYYVLKETGTPDGYRPLSADPVLYCDPDTSMLSVVSQGTEHAHTGSIARITGIGTLTYGRLSADTGSIEPDPALPVDRQKQQDGLIVLVPVQLLQSGHMEEAFYGNSLQGFQSIKAPETPDADAWSCLILRAALEQAADRSSPDWYFSWDPDTLRLAGTFPDLPGPAGQYRLLNSDGNRDLVCGIIETDALMQLGIQEDSPKARYLALAEYVREHGTEETLAAILNVTAPNTENGKGFRFLDADQFHQNLRSFIGITNERQELPDQTKTHTENRSRKQYSSSGSGPHIRTLPSPPTGDSWHAERILSLMLLSLLGLLLLIRPSRP